MTPTTYPYEVATIVGRWQLWHNGHLSLLREAFKLAQRVVIVVGSSFKARDPRNPFTAPERGEMILASLTQEERQRITFLPVRDYYDDGRWNAAVRKGVEDLTGRAAKVALVAFRKDHTTYYVDNFPQWKLHEVAAHYDIDATAMRRIFFETPDDTVADTLLKGYVPPGTLAWLRAWSKLPAFARCAKEHEAVLAYRKRWPGDVYLTADALVRTRTHVLLVRRGGAIGHGLWALPGGFIEVDKRERAFDAALRELNEETGFNPYGPTMRAALKDSAVFDHPLRSPRGGLRTQVFYFMMGFDEDHHPEVRGADDALEAKWVRISELADMQDQFFEDHYDSILLHFMAKEIEA